MALRASWIAVSVVGLIVAGCGKGFEGFDTTSSSSSGAGGNGTGGMGTGGASTSTSTSTSSNVSSGSSSSSGMVSPLCGNGTVDYQLGEECDDGNTTSGDGCSAACAVEAAATCGDGKLDLVNDEECDDGNTAAGDGCSPACQLEPVGQSCGDGQKQGLEVCDDGNKTNGDGCNPTCNLKGQTSLFAGSPGQGGTADGIGQAARFSGTATLTANKTHVFIGEGASGGPPPTTGARVRRVDVATALVETIAGSVMPGGYVDAPMGLNARFGGIEAITTDGSTLWVADNPNHRIRAVSLTAPYAVTTIAGSAMAGTADGIGAAAQLQDTRGLTYYNAYVYFVDAAAATLRRLNPATGEVVTLAGAPGQMGQVDGIGAAARFISPRYIASDGSGMLYVADTNGNKIRSFNTVNNEVKSFAGDGTCGYVDGIGAAARIHRPRGMTSDGTSIYWVEFNAHTIRQADVLGASVTTFAGSVPNPCILTCTCPQPPPQGGYAEGVGTMAAFNNPWSIAFHFPSNSLFVMDSQNFVLRRIQ